MLVVEPDYAPYEKEIDGLKEMQDVVGGSIQAIYPFEEQVAVVCNEEGLLLDMPFNRSMEGGYGAVFGPFFVCGLSEDILPCQIWGIPRKNTGAEVLLRPGALRSRFTCPVRKIFAAWPPPARGWPGPGDPGPCRRR